jgi:transcriptional regulator with XRE-family HTH domain
VKIKKDPANLRYRRINAGLTSDELARKIGEPKAGPSIRYVEMGANRPRPARAKKLGDALGFDWTVWYPELKPQQDEAEGDTGE